MLNQLKLYGVILAVLLVVDFLWIGVVANRFYVREFGEIGRISDGKFQVIYWAAVGVYLLLGLGLLLLALPRVNAEDAWYWAAIWGGLVGLITYGVYDFTNHATLKHWPVLLLTVDMAWGTFVCALTTVVARWARDSWVN